MAPLGEIMQTPIDIETIPDQRLGIKEQFIQASIDNFKSPSGLTKNKAALDLGMTNEKEIKFTSKDQMISLWEREMAPKLAESVGIENWRKTALDGSQGQIFSIAYDASEPVVIWSMDEQEVLGQFNEYLHASLQRLDRNAGIPYFIGHNIGKFDLKFIWRRMVINGIKPLFRIPHNGRHGKDFFDNQVEWCFYGDRISQDKLCKLLGVEGKPGDIDGSKVWDFVEAGEYQRVADYNLDDVAKVKQIYNRLMFV